jgi:hypothetical protein
MTDEQYSLISNEWIDKRIETLEAIRDQLIKEDMPYNSTQNRIDELRSIKELQLIPSEKLLQQEVSNENIYNQATIYILEDFITSIDSFFMGAKWMQEQLKSK